MGERAARREGLGVRSTVWRANAKYIHRSFLVGRPPRFWAPPPGVQGYGSGGMSPSSGTTRFDLAVVGAGVFGAWIARRARDGGRSVLLIDAYGAGNLRASSGGETRIIRCGYGADEIYSRWARQSRDDWRDLAARAGVELFHAS